MDLDKQEETDLVKKSNEAIIRNDYELAKTYLVELIRLCPYKTKYYEILGYVYDQTGYPLKSLEMRITAAKISNNDFNQWEILLNDCENANAIKQAEVCIKRLTLLRPNNQNFIIKLINIYRSTGQSFKMLSCYNDLLRLTGDKFILKEGLSLCLGDTKYLNGNQFNKMGEKNENQFNKMEEKNENQFNKMEEKNENQLNKMGKNNENQLNKTKINNPQKKEENSSDQNQIKSDDEMSDINISSNYDSDFESQLSNEIQPNLKDINMSVATRMRKATALLENYFQTNSPHGLKTLSFDLEETRYITLLCELYVDLGEFIEINNFITAIPQEDHKFLPQEVWVCAAVALISIQKFDKLQSILERCSLIENPDENHGFRIGEAFLKIKKPAEAMKYLEPLRLSVSYQFPKFWYLFGYCSYLLGDVPAAELFLKKAVNSDYQGETNDDAVMNARLCLSKIYSSTKRLSLALSVLKMPVFARNSMKIPLKSKTKNKLKARQLTSGLNFHFNKPKHLELGLKIRTKKYSRILSEYNFQKERVYLGAKLELISEFVADYAPRKLYEELISRTSTAVDDLLFNEIHNRQIFSFKRFVTSAIVLVWIWKRPEYINRRRNSLHKMALTAAVFLSKARKNIEWTDKIRKIIYAGALDLFTTKKWSDCFDCLKILFQFFPNNENYASLYVDLMEQSNYDGHITKTVIRLHKTTKKRYVAILYAFCSMHTRFYINAATALMEVYDNDNPRPVILLYCSCILSGQYKKRTCFDTRFSVLAIAMARKYCEILGNNAVAIYNLATIYHFLGRKTEAFEEYERVLTAKDTAPDHDLKIKCVPLRFINVILKYTPGMAYKSAITKLSEMCVTKKYDIYKEN